MNNEPNNQKPEETSSGSLLDQIMTQPVRELTPEEKEALDAKEKADLEAAKPKKRAMTLKEKFRVAIAMAFALTVVVTVSVGYVIFNPDLAVFFKDTFGLKIGDVAKLLGQLLLGAFYAALAFCFAGWIYLLVRAFLAKRFKGTAKFVLVLSAGMAGLLVNGAVVLGYSKARSQLAELEYSDAQVALYDNDVYVQLPAGQKDAARIADPAELIGPVSIRFNLDGFVRGQKGLQSVDRFVFDFDGDGQPDMNGREVFGNQSFIWRYDRPKGGRSFQPSGTIYATDVNKKQVEIPVPFPMISVVASVRVVETKERTGGVRVAFDASELKTRGNVEWYVESGSGAVASSSYEFTPSQVFTKTQWVCLNVFQGSSSDGSCKKYFVVRADGDNLIDGELALVQDPVDFLNYKFRVDGLKFKQGALESVRWFVDGIGQGDGVDVAYRFRIPGTYDVKAVVRDTSGNEKDFPQRLIIDEPITIMAKEGYGVKLADESGKDIIAGTFDQATNSYIVDGVGFPQTLSFDAANVKAASRRLRLQAADWDLDGDNQFELTGALAAKLLLTREKVYTVHVRYNFVNLSTDGERPRSSNETITISTRKNPFDVRLLAVPDQDFAPAKVTLDASSSQADGGEIVKFIFDYGDGQEPAENSKGQAVHMYPQPGTYVAKVTAYKNDGSNQSKTVTFTVRKPQNVATINASVSKGRAGRAVTFDADESRGSPSQVLWDFGDGTTGNGAKVDHAYGKPGTYEVKLEVRYSDGAVENDKMSFEVIPDPDAP